MNPHILTALLLTLPCAHAGTFTGKVYNASEVRRIMAAEGIPRLPSFAGTHYAEFSRAELVTFHAVARHRISREFGPQWNDRLNCFGLCWSFVDAATKASAKERFHAPLPEPEAVERPAVILVCLKWNGESHALLLLLTDEGPVWLDPQAGIVRKPTAKEMDTVWYPSA